MCLRFYKVGRHFQPPMYTSPGADPEGGGGGVEIISIQCMVLLETIYVVNIISTPLPSPLDLPLLIAHAPIIERELSQTCVEVYHQQTHLDQHVCIQAKSNEYHLISNPDGLRTETRDQLQGSKKKVKTKEG